MVAWWAHIGGFATGFLLTLLLRSRFLVVRTNRDAASQPSMAASAPTLTRRPAPH